MRSARLAAVVPFALLGVAAVVFWRTAYPTITWWDSGNYSLAAATLGVASAPGSLLLTLLGWPVAHLTLGSSPAYVLNLFAGALAALTVGLVYVVALSILRNMGVDSNGPTTVGAALGALTFAFSATLWEHAIKFTPYVLSALFTGLILYTLMRWWEDADRPNAWRWLAGLAVLFGLDFSVHRTNALLIPGALAWILVRDPRIVSRPKPWLAGIGGMALGLAVQLLIIPISATTTSPLNVFEPSSWSRFWDYVSLAQNGGGFLVDFWPRNSNIWSVQLADFLGVLRANFFHSATPVGFLGWLPGCAALLGLVTLWRRNRRLGRAFTLVLLLHAAMTVLYFNIPANYFRPFDRHYLPVFVSFGVLIAVALGAAMQSLARLATVRQLAAVGVAAAIILIPAYQLIGNWSAYDASARYFTRDYAVNALEALPPNAIYFTVGDNDTFPVLYVQAVEGVRPDVRIVNLSLANATWYVDQIARRDRSFPFPRSTDGRRLTSTVIDTTAVIAVRGSAEQFGLAADTSLPTSITVRPRPSIPADTVLFDIVRSNAWRSPLAFAITGGNGAMAWLAPYGRLEGLYWRIVPIANLGPNRDTLRSNLLQRYEYRGYANDSVRIDDTSRTMAFQYLVAFTTLLDADKANGAAESCDEATRKLLTAFPPERLALPELDRAAILSRCRS